MHCRSNVRHLGLWVGVSHPSQVPHRHHGLQHLGGGLRQCCQRRQQHLHERQPGIIRPIAVLHRGLVHECLLAGLHMLPQCAGGECHPRGLLGVGPDPSANNRPDDTAYPRADRTNRYPDAVPQSKPDSQCFCESNTKAYTVAHGELTFCLSFPSHPPSPASLQSLYFLGVWQAPTTSPTFQPTQNSLLLWLPFNETAGSTSIKVRTSPGRRRISLSHAAASDPSPLLNTGLQRQQLPSPEPQRQYPDG